jgi:alkanesulfonate monooxygenase SsuD/methylene tetrahydromethanopterin reductase-like flavin-dependent oxidoreductase (luciferase family)
VQLAMVVSGRMFAGRPLTELVEVARQADQAGLDYVCLAEHVVTHASPDLSSHPAGRHLHAPLEVWPEPLATLAGIAAATHRIGLMTGILIAPLRPAALLARAAATVQEVSRGRLVLGVSTSWQREEYEALGTLFEDRGAMLTDTIRTCRAAWGWDIPVWFGGKLTPRLVRRVVELGSGWIPFQGYGESLEEIGQRSGRLREALAAAGRDGDALQVACWMRTAGRSLPEVLDDLPAMAASGITVGELLFAPFVDDPADCGRFFEELARRFEPYRSLGTVR